MLGVIPIHLNPYILIFLLAIIVYIIYRAKILSSNINKLFQAQQKAKRKELKYKSLFKYNHDGIFILTTTGHISKMNAAAEKIIGYQLTELSEKEFTQFIHPDDLPFVENISHKSLEGISSEFNVRVQVKDQKWLHLFVKNVPMVINGEIDGIYCIVKDITKQTETEKQLRDIRLQMNSFFECTKDAINIVSLDHTLTYINPAFETMFGWTRDEVIGKPLPILPASFAKKSEEMHEALIAGGYINDFEAVFVRKDGSEIDVRVTLSPLKNAQDEIYGISAIIRDNTERKHFEKQLKQMAFYDSLTNIPNRRLFLDRLSHASLKSKKQKGSFGLMYLDCDRFKWINDTYGHDVGDELLKGFVNRINTCIRETDTLARLGGDEFAIILDGLSQLDEIEKVANRIVQTLQTPWKINGHEFVTTSSIGIAISPEDGTDMDTLLSHADQAMYISKQKGRNTYHFYSNPCLKVSNI